MPLHLRRAFFYFYVGLFLLLAPLVVLFTAGYRLNFSTWQVAQLGAISLTSSPKGATISLDHHLLSGHTPILARRTLPGTYDLTISKEGYSTWERQIEVKSRQTTVVQGAVLFLQSTPTKVLDVQPVVSAATSDGAYLAYGVKTDPWFEVWLVDLATDRLTLLDRVSSRSLVQPVLHFTHDDYLLILDDAAGGRENRRFFTTQGMLDSVPNWFADYGFTDNGTITELTQGTGVNQNVLARLPLGSYLVDDVFGHLVLVRNQERTMLVLIDTATSGPPILFRTNASIYRFNGDTLYLSDGFESHRYDTKTNTDQLITRSGTPIQSVLLYPSGDTLFMVRATNVIASDVSDATHPVNTTIFSADDIQSFFINSRGTFGYAIATVDGAQGLYQIALEK